MTNAELQKQIEELKEKIELLQNTGGSIPKRMQTIRRKAMEKYYGNWNYFYHTDIQVCPNQKKFSDYEYLRVGMERLVNIIYKHGRDIGNSEKTISSTIESSADLEEYGEIANYIVETMIGKIKELRQRHNVDQERESAECA